MNRRAEEHEAKLAELMERDEVRTMQQDCPNSNCGKSSR